MKMIKESAVDLEMAKYVPDVLEEYIETKMLTGRSESNGTIEWSAHSTPRMRNRRVNGYD